MEQSIAQEGVYTLLTAIQKCRARQMELFDIEENPDEQPILVDLSPWLFGEKSMMIPVMRIIDRLEKGGELSGMEWYNLRYVAFRLEPLISMAWGMVDHRSRNWEPRLPMDIHWGRA